MGDSGTNRLTGEPSGSVLERACARNTPVELHRRGSEGLEPVMRARLIALDEANLYLDSPQTIGRHAHLEVDEELEAYFDNGDDMFTFETAVVHPRCYIQLNSDKKVPGLSVTRPQVVRRGQRRSYFRRCVAGEAEIAVHLHATNPRRPDVCPLDSMRLDGTLVDASEGGFGVNVPDDPARQLKLWDHIFVRFRVPRLSDEIVLLCEVRQLRELARIGQVRLGLMALPWPDHRYLNLTVRPLAKYLVDLERKARGKAA